MYSIRLCAYGNPDHGEDPYRNIVNGIRIPDFVVEAKTIDEIIRCAKDYIDKYDLGSGNWKMTEVKNTNLDIVIGWMSYNGRIWSEKR